MSNSKLIELSYYDPSAQVRLSAYADTIVLDHDQNGSIISAIRFGGYPEMVRAMADAIYGGATIEAAQNDTTRMLQSSLKSYQRQITHDGIYAVATLMAADTVQEDDRSGKHEKDEDTNLVDTEQMELQPRRCYIFCPARDQKRLFEELDHKTAAPLIPEFQDYVLSSLRQRGDLRQLEVISLKERMDAWVLDLKPQDQNVVEVLEQGLQSGDIQIPGAVPNMPDVFENVENVTGYLNTFGVTVAARIRNQVLPLFDPAKEPLSDEVLAINDCIMSRVGYSLYDAQLAVAEAVKRQLARKRVALIIAECGSGKTKIGSTALGALHGLWADQKRKDGRKSFGIVMCPSHVTQKWVREIGETLPDTYGMVVRTIQDLNRLYAMYEKGDKSVFAVFSKEQARDGYMRYPAVRWNRRRRAFLCPDCDGVIEMEISEDGSRYTVPADQFFFQKEHKKNHTCPHCGKGGYNMSIKSQEGHMRQLALLLTTDLGCIFGERESGPNGSKKAFLNVGKVFLRALAKDLGLHEVTVSANSGGIAVSGTCSLYGMWEDRGIAVWIEQRLCADGKVLCYRTIRSSRDFKGGYNHFLTSSDLKTWSYHAANLTRYLLPHRCTQEGRMLIWTAVPLELLATASLILTAVS